MDDCLDWILDTIDELCWSGQFETIDQLLRHTNVYDTELTILICLLTITYCVRDRLPYREYFYNAIVRRLKEQKLDFKLVEGLG